MEQKKSKKPKLKIDYQKVEALAGRGLNKEEIARCLGMGKSTLYTKQKEDPKFLQCMEKGKAEALAAVTAKLFKAIQNDNMTAIIFFLKCRGGWKETSVIEKRDLAPLPADECSAEEAEAAYVAAMRTT